LTRKTLGREPLVAVILVALVASGCISNSDGTAEVGDLQTYDTFVAIGDAQAVKVNLDMGKGTLKVSPGGDHLMEATFKYNVDRWKPRFTYVEEGEYWNLTVLQPRQDLEVKGDVRNEWDLSFGLVVPMEMNVEMGSGDLNVHVSGLDILSLSVSTGAGEVDLDLSGSWYRNVLVRAGTGAGDVGLIVPSDMGVQVSVQQSAGTVIAPGFTQVQDNYVNSAFDTSDLVMLIAVDLGSGNLQVLEVP
jgi:hypothetical protein